MSYVSHGRADSRDVHRHTNLRTESRRACGAPYGDERSFGWGRECCLPSPTIGHMESCSPGAQVRVSVVVPVYNPGDYIEPLITSLLGQTLDPDEFEAVFVDDGSTDSTPARLDALAVEHAHLRVIHQPNSGWPGKPRNVGIDAAKGEYIQFVDHDDYLANDALAQLYVRAVETSSDIVIGKVVSLGRGSRISMFRRRIDRATLATVAFEGTLTPHKLFRTAMIRGNRIRFPEGKRRLEDHHFVMSSYFAAENIAVLADAPCYYFTKRSDGQNNALTRIDPAGYFGNVRETIDVVEANTEPGTYRNRILRRFYRQEMLAKLQEPRILRLPDEHRQNLFEHIKMLGEERFPESVPDSLPTLSRLRSVLLRRGDLEGLVQFAERCTQLRAYAELHSVQWSERDTLSIEFSSRVGFRDGSPVCFVPGEDGFDLDPRLVGGLFDRSATNVGDPSAVESLFTLDLTIREHGSRVEWWIPCSISRELIPIEGAEDTGARAVKLVCTAVLDPLEAGSGNPLAEGKWDVWVTTSIGGVRRESTLGSVGGSQGEIPEAHAVGEPPRIVRPQLTKAMGKLRLRVAPRRLPNMPTKRAKTMDDASHEGLATSRSWVRCRGDHVHLALSLPGWSPSSAAGAQLRLKRGADLVDAAANVQRDNESGVLVLADVPLGSLADGTWKLAVRKSADHKYKQVAGRLVFHPQNPIALLTGPIPRGSDKPLGRRTSSMTRRVASSLGRVADSVLQELPADRAVRYRATVRRVGRKLVS